jgi:MarR family transcriptional regulator, transcriptional regulator for hemolysin
MLTSAALSKSAPERSLGYLLVDAVRLMRKDFYDRSKGLKLTPALARLLYYVHRAPGSRQAELAARLEVTPVTLSRMLDRLAQRGYVRRAADSADRRAFRVFVDRAGEPLVGRMDQIVALTAARATRGLSERDRAALLRQLQRVVDNLSGAGR